VRFKKTVVGIATVALCTVLAGCVPSTPHPTAQKHLIAVPTVTPAQKPATPLATGIVDTVLVNVYAQSVFTAKTGCACKVSKSSDEEMFPKGTPVVMLRITLTGKWKPSQGDSTTQDVTGMSLKGTKFDGRPENAVVDTSDGPSAAAKEHLPWLPAGLFAGKATWTIPNDRVTPFVAAWYLPAGVDRLLLTVDVPSEKLPNDLTVDLTAEVVKRANKGGE
jgi:hypothetical protein